MATPYGYRVGALEPDGFLDLQAAEVLRLVQADSLPLPMALARAEAALPADMMAFLAAGRAAEQAARAALEFGRSLGRGSPAWYAAEVTPLGPVVPRPQKIMVMRGNYIRHRAEMAPRLGISVERPERPRFFVKPATAIVGHGQSIAYPRLSQEVHHEVELAVVIGKQGRWIPQEQAYDFIAGYTVFLDMTARDLSGKDDRNKSFDTFAPIGPCLVPPSDLGDPHELSLSLRVNGQVRQQGTTRDLEYRIPELVSFLSEATTLMPGDVISTGTPEGVGPVQPGDVIEAEIEGIGVLRCPVVAEAGR
jgi:5-oxopent-3-ene-1,2,5-tricarboxylate decarboxylase/2-hydroxyhepta-2,4-diene-1,7-dioate isomerase